MIIYPDVNYDSWISEDLADLYLETRLNADSWFAIGNKEAALMTAFRSINELEISLEFDENKILSDTYYTDTQRADILNSLQIAQCEQALHELKNDLDSPNISGLSLGGLLSVKIPANQAPPPRYAERALAILKPYIRSRTVARIR
jgi:hypothetical protein